MISFKNKSEEYRYLRVAKQILKISGAGGQTTRSVKTSLKNDTDVDHIYSKIFRFLADILYLEEFVNLTYFHVQKFIDKVI